MYSFKPSSCNLIFAKWFSETSLNEAVNCNTVVFSQALVYIILNQSSLCSMYQTVTWWITDTHKFLVHHQQKIKRYLSSEIKNTSYVCENPAAGTVTATYVCCKCILRYTTQLRIPVECPSGLSTTLYSRPLSAGPLTRSGRVWCVPGLTWLGSSQGMH